MGLWGQLSWPRFWSWRFLLGVCLAWLVATAGVVSAMIRLPGPWVDRFGIILLIICVLGPLRSIYGWVRDRIEVQIERAEQAQRELTERLLSRDDDNAPVA